MDTESRILGRRYTLHEQLGEGGMGQVFRATDRLTQREVALKRVTTSTNNLTFASKSSIDDIPLALAQEFQILASLRHPHIISVLDYGFDTNGQPYFTMDLLRNPQTIINAGADLTLEGKVTLLVEMLQALAYLHRRGVIHRDLKPSNVLVVDGQVRLLDFGVSVRDDQLTETVGTLTYMAPEILHGQTTTVAVDLYAVGVIAYEMLIGSYPFDISNLSNLIQQIVRQTVEIPSDVVPDALNVVIRRLLAKNPTDRYPDAMTTIRVLTKAAGMPLPLETRATRESYLQTAALVGRDEELSILTEVLHDAVRGEGSAWLIAGESGVGKSRLLDEIRVRALVDGAIVMRGQAVGEGGRLYQTWRMILRRLVLMVEVTDVEAAMLREVIPDIEQLLDRTVAESPRFDPTDQRNRLSIAIKDIFTRVQQPLVVMLEDLHWARDESIDLLMRLTQIVRDLPLLILASYRDDENSTLRKRLPYMETLKLERLSQKSIADLSVSMLGEAGGETTVVELLQRETEGNVFFLVEVVRALAEEAGNIEQIGKMTLPASVFAGGVQRIIRRRLDKVPQRYQRCLQLAAVAGREIDLDVLRVVEPEADVVLQHGLNAAVFGVYDESWRFAHEKLREALLVDLPEGIKSELHRDIAGAIEKVYPYSSEQNVALAYHWSQAGDLGKEQHYATLAGEQSLEGGAYGDARAFLERALVLMHDEAQEGEDGFSLYWLRNAYIMSRLADVYLGVGDYHEARTYYEASLEVYQRIADRKGEADCLWSLGVVAEVLGEYEAAQERYAASLEVYRESDDQPGMVKAMNSLGTVAYDLEDYDRANALYQESLALSRKIGNQWGMAGTISNTPNSIDVRKTLLNRLRHAIEVQAIHDVLNVLMRLAKALIEEHLLEQALPLLVIVIQHPATSEKTQDEAEKLMFAIEDVLPPDVVETVWSNAKALNFNVAMQRLLRNGSIF